MARTKVTSTTPKGREGFNISYSDEQRCGTELLAALPAGWTVHFQWFQILFSDVQYEIDKEKKTVEVVYNQNLRHWWPEVIQDIKEKINRKEP